MAGGGPHETTAGARVRIVSLVPSATETLLALGADVIACTRFCNQPHLATVGGTKNPDLDAIVGLRPDRVVVDIEENCREDADALVAAGLELVVTSVRSIEDATAVVRQLARASGVAAPSDFKAVDLAISTPLSRRAFVPIWRRPWMTISRDTYGAALLRSIGVDVGTFAGEAPYPTVRLDDVAADDPELVIVPSEPYSFTDTHVTELAEAFPDATVLRVDGEDLFWWGVRTPMARRRLGAVLDGADETTVSG